MIGDSSSKKSIQKAAEFLCGQKLTQVSINYKKCKSIFKFDYGAKLETEPYDFESEQWLLYMPNNKVLALRADLKFAYTDITVPDSDVRWQNFRATS